MNEIQFDEIFTIGSNGKSKSIDDFNIYEEYLTRWNEKPSLLKINGDNFEIFNANYIREKIKKSFPKIKILFKSESYSLKYKKNISDKEIWYIDDGYLLLLSIDTADGFYNDPKNDIGENNDFEICDYHNIILPNEESKYYNIDINKKFIEIFSESLIIEKKRPVIGMMSMDRDELYVKDFSISDKFNIKNMDLHYGKNFKKEFHDKLVKKLENDNKGLVLLHGKPGTGKTYFIRHLINKLMGNERSILYFPPGMVSAITDPTFINFINTWVSDHGKNCILLIEDAEPLLVSREDDGRNIGITNLLNLTDGLLNDIFGIQIIATFNTDISNLDDALLRPERLIARKEFTLLNKKESEKLFDKLKIDKSKLKDKMSLADIYNIKKNNEVLYHNVNDKNMTGIGFRL